MHPPKSLAPLGGAGTVVFTGGGVVSFLSVHPALTIGFTAATGVAIAALVRSLPRSSSRGLWDDDAPFERRVGAAAGVLAPVLLAPVVVWVELPVRERFALAGYLLAVGLAGAGGGYVLILTRLRRSERESAV